MSDGRATPREPEVIWDSRKLPIPVDAFRVVPLPDEPAGGAKKPSLAGLELWLTAPPAMGEQTLVSLVRRPLVSVLRVNSTKFGSNDELLDFLARCRRARRNRPNVRICLDLGAQKIRVRRLRDAIGSDAVDIFEGERLAIVEAARISVLRSTVALRQAKVIPISEHPSKLVEDGVDVVFISDGWVQLRVLELADDVLWCEALHDARTFEGRGVDVPGMYDRRPPRRDTDAATLRTAGEALEPEDLVALSFVNGPEDVECFRELAGPVAARRRIVSKIETRTGVGNAGAIAAVSDAVMIARGDLAVQLAPGGDDMLAVEDEIRTACREAGRPCVVATRVADSLERPSTELDDHERARLSHELSFGPPLALLLANETSDPDRAEQNVDIVVETIRELSRRFPRWSRG